ncbi:MAG TPA: DinB family protein [Terracidiphilus sp.]|nr:DinB family protein [Terracidiphilus sp.]
MSNEGTESAAASELAMSFRAGLEEIRNVLAAVPEEWAGESWRAGGWTRKQIVGHMLDSAANNRQRFVRATIDGHYAGPIYEQQAWVNAHGYAEQEWETLKRWWEVEHEILAAVVDRIPENRLEAKCRVGDAEPVTLRFLIVDYLRHQRLHAEQLKAG